ncbi:MAG: extracellular solute-binding protein [Nitrospirota bacterium]|nr:MAG: extracellular solute-binding protein [Nitrospirota bacterium]
MKRVLFTILIMLFFAGTSYADRIRCASTTSTQNSGLFEYLLPFFEKEAGVKVDVVAVGTGAAFKIGMRGDADVLLVHAKTEELRLVNEGYFVDRHDVMYNDFVILGPVDDPAGLRGIRSAPIAFSLINKRGTVFVSRGDNSGTHKKEMSIWKTLDMDPRWNKWYLEVGQGMAKAIRIASEKRAYILADRGTWLAINDSDDLGMEVLVEGDRILFNQYGVMIVNPERHGHVKYDDARKFVDFLISEKGQGLVASFRNKQGKQLFYPNAGK